MEEKKKILIIEDDGDMVEAMKLMLESPQREITAVDNPEKGFAVAKASKPDLIILDVMFGNKQESRGFEYAVKFKQEKALAPVPILMVTSVNKKDLRFHFSTETDEEYLPVDDFIDKPAQPEDLARKVETLLRQKTSLWAHWPQKGASSQSHLI